MKISCTSVRTDPDTARLLAEQEHPGLITRAVWAAVPKLRKKTTVVSIEPFYCMYYYCTGLLRLKRGKHIREAKMNVVMNASLGLVRMMSGVPAMAELEVPESEAAKNRYSPKQAEERMKNYMMKRGYKRFHAFPDVYIGEVKTVYKPFYYCLCERNGKTVARVIDAEVRDRDYLLDIQYKNLSFPKSAN